MKKLVLLVTGFVFVFNFTLQAQDLITAKDLAKIMKDKNVVIVSTRSNSDYKKVHILGAVHIDHHQLYKDGPIKAMIKSPAEIAKILGSQGISEKKKIVLYDDGSGKYSGRLYWILKYLGAPDVKILDGHMNAWRAARKPVTKNPTKVTPTTFTPKVNAALLATMADVKAAIGNPKAVLVDARSAKEFSGTPNPGIKKGHIPGAINIEYKMMLDANGKLKPVAELEKLFKSKGVTKDKEVILYCESSVRAGILFFVLHSALHYPNVKVYDGAYLEWQANNSNKIEV